ncbi:MAG: PTS sugar transporter subunit IIA [Candidatus Hydrogenedentes bacterium]|nr:PTS sugar transporter subunit IIA [Candidatus Hydrogenedentota bacterium]
MQLKIREVAKLLSVSDKTVYRWVKEGSLPAYRIHDQYRVDRTELLEWVTACKMPVSEEIFNESKDSEKRTSLAEAIEVGGCFYRVEGTDRASVLHSVVSTMRLPDGVDKEFLYRVLLARENVCSTAIGGGVAIPHPRSPIVLHVTEPSISLCFLEQPVEFGAMDGQPVRVLFTLVTPTVHTHLQLLSRVGYALQDSGFKSVLARPETREVILSEAKRLDLLIDGRMGCHDE